MTPPEPPTDRNHLQHALDASTHPVHVGLPHTPDYGNTNLGVE